MVNIVEFYSRLYAWGVLMTGSPARLVSDSRLGCMKHCLSNSTCSSFYFNIRERACYLHSRWHRGLVTADPPTNTNYYVLYTSFCWYPGYEYLRLADMCMKISSDTKSWWDEDDACQLDDARLATIDSSDKMTSIMDIVKSEFPGIIYFWLGGNDLIVEGSWKWMDGSAVTQYFWASPEPNDSGDCLGIGVWDSFDGWDDYTCANAERYICERK